MGAIWLLSLPDILSQAGLNVGVYPDWQTRSRSTGGYDAIHGVQVHQTVSNTAPANDMAYMWKNASAKPIGAIYLARNAKVTVGAAGATNTAGRGGPLGPIPKDRGNLSTIAVEAANGGYGEPWPVEQQDAYLKLVNALVEEYGPDFEIPGVHAHFEWTTRKSDPAGASRWATGANRWDMNGFRADAAQLSVKPTVNLQGVPDMFVPIQPFRNSDTRAYKGKGIAVGEYRWGLNPSVFPADVVAVAMNVTAVDPLTGGFVTIWPGGARPNASCLNFSGGLGATASAVTVGVDGLNGFMLHNSAVGHYFVDITGYWTP